VILTLLIIVLVMLIFVVYKVQKYLPCKCKKEKYASQKQDQKVYGGYESPEMRNYKTPGSECQGCGPDLPFQVSSLYKTKRDDKVRMDFSDI
jgi:hypothetical protein